MSRRRDRAITAAICAWFRENARGLPWRTSPRDPYFALVSEAMLLQTQASRVAELFPRFIRRFPTVRDLAGAEEQDVLALWSGLGYYRRATNLHRAAQRIMEEHAGTVPSDAASLRSLPGVGRYTAGAIASIAFNRQAPIVDGNVARVLLRVEGRDLSPADSATSEWLWSRAGELVGAAESPASFNEGLMELGATVCTPKAPRCGDCPVRTRCVARREGSQHDIPRPKSRAARTVVHAASVVMCDAKGRTLVERRDKSGMWAGLWQAPTVERAGGPPRLVEVRILAGGRDVRRVDAFEHLTTHREFRFTVYEAAPPPRRRRHQRWASREEIGRLALARPQMRILLGDAGA